MNGEVPCVAPGAERSPSRDGSPSPGGKRYRGLPAMRPALVIACALLAAPASAPAEEQDPDRVPSATLACLAGVPRDGGWSEAETWTWNKLCRGEPVRLDLMDEASLPCNPAEMAGAIPAHRRLSARFLERILTDPRRVDTLARPRITIACAHVEERLDLADQRVAPDLGLLESRLAQGADLSGARFDRSVRLSGSSVGAGLDATGALFEAGLALNDGAVFYGDVLVADTKIAAHLDVAGSTFLGTLNVDGAFIGGDLTMDEGATFERDVVLRDLIIGGELAAAGSTVNGRLDVSGTKIAGGVSLHGGATFRQDVDFTDMKAGGDFDADGSTFEGVIDVDGGSVDGDLFLREGVMKGDVVLSYAKLGGTLVAEGSSFEGSLDAEGIRVDRNVFLRNGTAFEGGVDFEEARVSGTVETSRATFQRAFSAPGLRVGGGLLFNAGSAFGDGANLRGARLSQDLVATGAHFDGRLDAEAAKIGGTLALGNGAVFNDISLRHARIDGSLRLRNGRFRRFVDATGATVDGEIQLSSSPLDAPDWEADAHLILRNASAGALWADPTAWRRAGGAWLSTELTGFSYRHLGRLATDGSAVRTSMADIPPEQLIAWIEESQPDHDAAYDPQPYVELATALGAAGAPEAARRVHYARYEHKRRVESTPRWEMALLTASRWFIGYGIYPSRSLWWLLGLLGCGIVVAAWSRAEALRGLGPKVRHSLESAVPMLELSEAYRELDHGSVWVAGYFVAQQVLGYALVALLLGALVLGGS